MIKKHKTHSLIPLLLLPRQGPPPVLHPRHDRRMTCPMDFHAVASGRPAPRPAPQRHGEGMTSPMHPTSSVCPPSKWPAPNPAEPWHGVGMASSMAHSSHQNSFKLEGLLRYNHLKNAQPGFRRLTRGSRVSVVSLVIPVFQPIFS